MNNTLNLTITMTTVTCCYATCGIVFGVPDTWERVRRNDHTPWYCPNGHRQHFSGKSEEEKLREALASANGNLKWYREYSERKEREATDLTRQRTALRGVITRTKKRAHAGVCQWCNRSFVNVQRHMASKHADVSTDDQEITTV